eukprot:959080-Rhodomonas_salina.1
MYTDLAATPTPCRTDLAGTPSPSAPATRCPVLNSGMVLPEGPPDRVALLSQTDRPRPSPHCPQPSQSQPKASVGPYVRDQSLWFEEEGGRA